MILGCAALGLGGIGIAKAVSTAPVQTSAVAAGTYTYDFVTNFTTYAASWGTNYTTRTIASSALGSGLAAATITLGSANAQSSTSAIHDRPVSKASDNTFELTETGFHIASFKVTVAQWLTKVPSFDVYVDGESTKLLSSSTFGLAATGSTGTIGTSGDIAISGTATKKIHFQNTSTNQIGYSSIAVTIAADPAFGTLDHIKLNTASTTLKYKVGDTFSSSGISATAYDGSDETTSSSKSLTAADLVFKHGETNLSNYVFTDADVSTAFAITASYTEESIVKTDTYSVMVEKTPFTTMSFSSATDGFTSVTVSNSSFVATKTYDSNRWTLSVTGASAVSVYAASANGSYFDEQIGNSTTGATTISLRSGIIKGSSKSEVKISKVELVALGSSSSTAATISCKVGNTTCATTGTMSGNAATAFVFDFSTPDYGHIELNFTDIAKGIKIRSVAITGSADTSDKGSAYAFAHDIEIANSCTTASYSAINTAYTNLSSAAKTIADAIGIDDMADGQTSYAVIDRCTVSQKLAAMKTRAEASGTSGVSFAPSNDESKSLLITFASLSAVAVGASFIFRKKKQA